MSAVLVLAGAPLAGVWLAGVPIEPYLAFPPRTRFVDHPGFSSAVFVALTLLVVLALAPFVTRVVARAGPPEGAVVRRFPAWGWAGVALVAISWWLAWTRQPWFEPLQAHTFAPLWLGYVVTVNALAWRRGGRALMVERPRAWLTLFVVSAAFWWFFEFLNRFVQNWYYVDVGTLSAAEYFWRATGPFATVLPAVLGTRDWLATHPRLFAGLADAWRPRPRRPRGLAILAVALGIGGLGALGVWPTALFPLLWLAPLAVLLGLEHLAGRPTVLSPLARGDWRGVWLAALAALVCGLFWELWNWGSLARWSYSVPWVGRFHLFEMPALGYAGYLPFGIECVTVAAFVARAPEHFARPRFSPPPGGAPGRGG